MELSLRLSCYSLFKRKLKAWWQKLKSFRYAHTPDFLLPRSFVPFNQTYISTAVGVPVTTHTLTHTHSAGDSIVCLSCHCCSLEGGLIGADWAAVLQHMVYSPDSPKQRMEINVGPGLITHSSWVRKHKHTPPKNNTLLRSECTTRRWNMLTSLEFLSKKERKRKRQTVSLPVKWIAAFCLTKIHTCKQNWFIRF